MVELKSIVEQLVSSEEDVDNMEELVLTSWESQGVRSWALDALITFEQEMNILRL
jgi:hypothetical protein